MSDNYPAGVSDKDLPETWSVDDEKRITCPMCDNKIWVLPDDVECPECGAEINPEEVY